MDAALIFVLASCDSLYWTTLFAIRVRDYWVAGPIINLVSELLESSADRFGAEPPPDTLRPIKVPSCAHSMQIWTHFTHITHILVTKIEKRYRKQFGWYWCTKVIWLVLTNGYYIGHKL